MKKYRGAKALRHFCNQIGGYAPMICRGMVYPPDTLAVSSFFAPAVL